MGPFIIVEMDVVRDPLPGFARVEIIVQVHLLVFERTPEALSKDVIQGAPAAIHTDLDLGSGEPVEILRAGEMAALAAVTNLRRSLGQGGVQGLVDERLFQGRGKFPGDDKAGIPIQNGDQIQPAVA